MFVVTPWEVRGKVDYEKLIKKFGTKPIDQRLLNRIKKHTKELHFMLRRGIFFSHRDLDWILDEYEKGNKFFLYTGRAPSGPVHIGHLIPWIFTKWLQNKFDVELWFQFPDEEKFLFKEGLSLKDTKKWTRENALDVIALGFDPKKTYFLVDTIHAKLMYREACRVAKKITLSTAKATFGFTNKTNIGSIFYTAMQSVPAFLPSVLKGRNVPCLIPYAIDQDAHFRIARDVLPKLGCYKPAAIHSKFVPGLGAGIKMSASEPQSCIFTTDTEEEIEKKIMNAFTGGGATVEEQKKKGGKPEICSVYQYYYFLFEKDDEKLKEIYESCKSGKRVCGHCKQILAERVKQFVAEHQKRRKEAEKLIEKFMLKIGSEYR